MFQELEFKRWVSDLTKGEAAASVVKKDTQYSMVASKEDFNAWLDKLKQANVFALDTETTSIDPMRADLVGISFAVTAGEAAYVPLTHDYEGVPEQLDKQWVLEQLKPLLEDPNNMMIGQNIKYDLKILANAGCTAIEPKIKMWDTLLASYVLNSTSARHDMDTLALKYLGRGTIKYEEVAGKGVKQVTFDKVALDIATQYAAEDADVTLQLYQTFKPMLAAESCFQKMFDEIEMPLMPILAKMEYSGVLIDAEMLCQQSTVLAKRIKDIEEEVYSISGEEFNLNSTKQLQEVLYEKLKLPILKKTPKGQPSTAEPVMQELALDYPLPKMILEFRSFSKLKSTYTDALPEQINPKTGRVHTHYNQAVTSTGRLSSKDPNLQNIPVRTEEGRKIRQAFIASQGCKIVAADYSQVELRIMAHLSQDPGLLKAFDKGWDVHRSTAAEVFGVALNDVTSEQRRGAKAINFGLMYGMSAFGLSRQLGIGRKEADEHMKTYFAKYPKVHDYMEQARQQAAEKGYVETLLGRRLFVPDIKATNGQRRMAAERAAINAPLQGTAADIIKLAMLCIDEWLNARGNDITMIMQVHDELVFEVPEALVDEASMHIKKCMEESVKLSVPLLVEIGVGDNWDQAH